jgi:hypothetical protein
MDGDEPRFQAEAPIDGQFIDIIGLAPPGFEVQYACTQRSVQYGALMIAPREKRDLVRKCRENIDI